MTKKRYKKLMRAYYTHLVVDGRQGGFCISSSALNTAIRNIDPHTTRYLYKGKRMTRQEVCDTLGVEYACKTFGDEFRMNHEIQ